MKNRLTSLLALIVLITGFAFAQDGITVIWGEDRADHATLDPRVTQSRHEEQMILQIFDPLIYNDGAGNFVPGLATAWEVSDDGLAWTFTLREDVTFHDGTPFNAEAVKFTFDSIQDPDLGSQGAIDILGPYASSEVLSEFQVRVNYERPYASALNAFSETELSIVSPSAVAELGNDGFARNPVGTGPFKFVSWEAGLQVILERNDDYNWAPSFYSRQGPSEVERVVLRFIADTSTRAAALEAGEINIADLVTPLDLLNYQSSDEFDTLVGNVAGLPFSMMFNTTRGPFQDIRVRQAFMHSVDRPRLAENLFFGFAEAAYGPLSATTPNYWSGVEDYYLYDPERASALLDEAGWVDGDGDGVREKDGETLSVFFPALLEPDTAVAIQAEAGKVGFDVQVENVLKARQDELIFANDYDTLVIRWVSNDPGVLIIPFHTRNIPEPGKFAFNWARWDDPTLNQLLEDAESASSPDERAALYQQIQQMIMDAGIFFPLHDQLQMVAHDSELTGFSFAPGNWQVRFYDVTRAN